MGIYLNSTAPFTLYGNESVKPYFVDKSKLLKELFPLVEQGSHYICITRPRRFGKTIMANMIASYFSKAKDASALFQRLEIAEDGRYRTHLNQYNVIHISFNVTPSECNCYTQYIQRVQKKLIKDLKRAYPNCETEDGDAVWDILSDIYEYEGNEKFIFVLDEWDYIFHQDYITEKDKKSYVRFLSSLLKDKPYVTFVYMTGILPIAKYSSGSELNMFLEYTFATEERFSRYFGFDDGEVDALFQRYLRSENCGNVTREGLRYWYDGYQTMSGTRLYNPRSVVASLQNNQLGNYWTSSGPYDEIFYYIRSNVDEVRDDIGRMVSGIPVLAEIREYAASAMELSTKNEIFSAMVVYGFLTYEKGRVWIPNKELMDKFADMVKKKLS